jgi:hypothetical protein
LPNPGAAAVADFDLDGDLDLVTSVVPDKGTWTKGSLLYFRNQLGEHNNWIRVELRGAWPHEGANRMGKGGWVKVTSGGRAQLATRSNTWEYGNHSASSRIHTEKQTICMGTGPALPALGALFGDRRSVEGNAT